MLLFFMLHGTAQGTIFGGGKIVSPGPVRARRVGGRSGRSNSSADKRIYVKTAELLDAVVFVELCFAAYYARAG
jgi:hypothetical protein